MRNECWWWRFLCGVIKMFLNQIVVMTTWFCDYIEVQWAASTLNHWTVSPGPYNPGYKRFLGKREQSAWYLNEDPSNPSSGKQTKEDPWGLLSSLDSHWASGSLKDPDAKASWMASEERHLTLTSGLTKEYLEASRDPSQREVNGPGVNEGSQHQCSPRHSNVASDIWLQTGQGG